MKFKSEPDPHSSTLHVRESILCDACGNSNPPCRCANCHLTYYCHEACAKNHWQVHKAYCKSPADILKQSQLVQASDIDDDASTKICEMCERAFDHPQYHYKENSSETTCCNRTYCLQCMDHFQTYTSSLVITSSKATTTCPLCRIAETEEASTNYKFHQEAIWTAKAASMQTSSEQQQTSKFAHKALDHVEALLDQDSNNQAAKILQGRILGLLGEYDLGLILLTESLQKLKTTVPQQQKVDELMQQVKENMMSGQITEAEALLEEIQTLRNQKFALFVQPTDLVELQLSIADLELGGKAWMACQDTLKEILSTENSMTPNQQLQAYLKFAECCYETKHYDKAIEFSKLAIDMNRHYPQVYKYLILAHHAKGEVELAQSAASRAVLYETPWDPQNQQRTQERYQELLNAVATTNNEYNH
jgi:tetratricopeptide (TPR) repeat protein